MASHNPPGEQLSSRPPPPPFNPQMQSPFPSGPPFPSLAPSMQNLNLGRPSAPVPAPGPGLAPGTAPWNRPPPPSALAPAPDQAPPSRAFAPNLAPPSASPPWGPPAANAMVPPPNLVGRPAINNNPYGYPPSAAQILNQKAPGGNHLANGPLPPFPSSQSPAFPQGANTLGQSQPMGGVPSFSQRSIQPPPSNNQMGYGMMPPPTAATTSSGRPTWPGAPTLRSYPPAFGTTPNPTFQSATQTVPPAQPPPMGQYPGPATPQPGSPMTSAAPRVDPSQIPRPPQTNTSPIVYETRANNQAALPPPATSNFIAKDMGNCSPRYMRCSLNQIPCTGDMLTTSGMPFVLIVQPLALPHPSEEPIQIVDFGESGPVRCSRCKAYINPFMKFIDQGRHFNCNLCGFKNATPRDYLCNLGPDGRRRDADDRPELSRGIVEFVATKEFMVRPPMPAVFFFMVDVSLNAVQTGAAAAACNAIERVLGDLPEGLNTKVGIATFDSTLHFYNLNTALQQPSMLVVPDIQEVYTPLQTGLIVPLTECRLRLEQLLQAIPSMFQNTRIPDSAFGAAIKGAALAMKSTGGKLLVFQSALPSVGLGALSAREAEGRMGPSVGEKEANKLLQPVDKTFKTLAIEFAEYQVCVDLFLTTQSYVDVASLAVVPRTTGGQVYYYHPFSVTADSAKLYNDLRWNVSRPQGLEAVMRVRCSQGVQVQEYFGNFCQRIPTDVDFPAIDCDKAILATLKYDDKFPEGSECSFQCALLYTTLHNERRIRVITLSLPCTASLNSVFRGADLDAQVTYFLKHAVHQVPSTALPQVREDVINSCVNILYAYRKFCAATSSSGQLILPEALKLLPLYTLALTKSAGLRSDVRIDDRCYWITRVASISVALSFPSIYPRMFAIHNLETQDMGNGILPPYVYLLNDSLDIEGIYLLETGEDAFIFAEKAVPPDVLFKLFGVRSVNEMDPSQFVLQEYDNEGSRKLNALVNEIRQQRSSYLRMRWCKRGDPLEFIFFSLLVEDKNSLGDSYVDFLVRVHKQIQNKMT